MTIQPPCSACGLPHRTAWPTLARNTQHGAGVATVICPRCTFGRTGAGRRQLSLRMQYKTRCHPTHDHFAPEELDNGELAAATPASRERVLARRLQEVLQAAENIRVTRLSAGELTQPIRVLHIGCGAGDLMMQLRHHAPHLEVHGVEPVEAWADAAKLRGLAVSRTTVEEMAQVEPFDLIVEHHVLEHLEDPRKHLKCLRKQLAADGMLILEVPNVLQAWGGLESQFLQLAHPNVFTARALATLCSSAGLVPIVSDPGADLVMACRSARPGEGRKIADGPDADQVIMAALANDVRLTLKRGFWRSGATHEMLELAEKAHHQCTWGPGKADIAIEAAVACEREDKLATAERWLTRSLEDRKDPEVSLMLIRVQTILRHRGQQRVSDRDYMRPNLHAFRTQPVASLRN